MEVPARIFDPIKKNRTFEEVAIKIKELIFDGILNVGDKLPSEKQLAQQFGVGRQTIREALRLLEHSGFISIHKGGGGGAVIKNTVLNRISELFLDAFRMQAISIHELTEARLEIERIVLNHAMENADESDIRDLEKNVSRAREKIKKGVLATEENFEFHKLLAMASKNHVFVVALESIMAVHADFISRVGFDFKVSRNVVSSHGNILEAIKAKDRKRANKLLGQHIVDVKVRLQQVKL